MSFEGRPRNVLDRQVIHVLGATVAITCRQCRGSGSYATLPRDKAARSANVAYLIQRHLDDAHANSRIEPDMTYWLTSVALKRLKRTPFQDGQVTIDDFKAPKRHGKKGREIGSPHLQASPPAPNIHKKQSPF